MCVLYMQPADLKYLLTAVKDGLFNVTLPAAYFIPADGTASTLIVLAAPKATSAKV